MSDFGSGGLMVVITGAYLIAIPFIGFWMALGGFLLTATIAGFALQGANDAYHPDGSRKPHHSTRNPPGRRRRR